MTAKASQYKRSRKQKISWEVLENATISLIYDLNSLKAFHVAPDDFHLTFIVVPGNLSSN